MEYETLHFAVFEDIATITMHRPNEMNALNAQMRAELLHAFEFAQDDARVVVLTGHGNAFCSGQDLGTFGDRRQYRYRNHLARRICSAGQGNFRLHDSHDFCRKRRCCRGRGQPRVVHGHHAGQGKRILPAGLHQDRVDSRRRGEPTGYPARSGCRGRSARHCCQSGFRLRKQPTGE